MRLIRAWATAILMATLVVLIESTARLRLISLANGLCSLGELCLGEFVFREQRAYVRSYAGDVDGALAILAEQYRDPEFAFFKALHSGMICEHHGLKGQAAQWFRMALSAPDPGKPVGVEFRTWMEGHIRELSAPTESPQS